MTKMKMGRGGRRNSSRKEKTEINMEVSLSGEPHKS
jgi:hypothetical protein